MDWSIRWIFNFILKQKHCHLRILNSEYTLTIENIKIYVTGTLLLEHIVCMRLSSFWGNLTEDFVLADILDRSPQTLSTMLNDDSQVAFGGVYARVGKSVYHNELLYTCSTYQMERSASFPNITPMRVCMEIPFPFIAHYFPGMFRSGQKEIPCSLIHAMLLLQGRWGKAFEQRPLTCYKSCVGLLLAWCIPNTYRIGPYDDVDVSFYNSTASTWILATPRTTWES